MTVEVVNPGQATSNAEVFYVDQTAVSTPVISPGGGSFGTPVQISLSDNTPGAVIYYALNGSTPTISSTPYSLPFTLSSSATVKAAAFLQGYNPSGVASAAFAVNAPVPSLFVGTNRVPLSDNSSTTGIYVYNAVPNSGVMNFTLSSDSGLDYRLDTGWREQRTE